MSRAVSRNTMRCLEIAFLVTLLNLLLSFTVVQWYSADSSSSDSASLQASDSRLLLSVEYQDTPDVTPPANSAIGALEVVTSVIVVCCVASLLGTVFRCVQLKRK